jgi:hypothetical protein
MGRYLWLVPTGFVIGAYGTLIGAGGGFLLVPLMILLYPKENAEVITSVSLAVVFFNALSGSVAYARMGRIDYKSGSMFSAATIPGAILGALTTAYIPRRLFDVIFGLLMVAASAFMAIRPTAERETNGGDHHRPVARGPVEPRAEAPTLSYNPMIGVTLSFFVGYISSLLGIGGGIIHVPALVHLLNFPVHVATATSHFILAVMAFTGTIVHIAAHEFSHGVRRTIALAVGVLPGAQLGAQLSNRVRGDWIIRGLAIALGFVGVRILIQAL